MVESIERCGNCEHQMGVHDMRRGWCGKRIEEVTFFHGQRQGGMTRCPCMKFTRWIEEERK